MRRLEADGLIRRAPDGFRTTRQWQSAMARAALALYQNGDSGEDLRVPIVCALLEIYGADASDEEIAARALALLPIEAAEVDPRPRLDGTTGAATPALFPSRGGTSRRCPARPRAA